MDTTTTFSYDGIRFLAGEHPTATPHDAAGTPTIGHYHQQGDLVWAEFGGGRLRTGRLVGTARPDGTIDAAYCQVAVDGTVVAGTVVSTPERLPDGRIRLIEDWRRADGSTGVSMIEEYPYSENEGTGGAEGERGCAPTAHVPAPHIPSPRAADHSGRGDSAERGGSAQHGGSRHGGTAGGGDSVD